MVCKTNPSPDSHNSTPSHQLTNRVTGLTLFRWGDDANLAVAASVDVGQVGGS